MVKDKKYWLVKSDKLKEVLGEAELLQDYVQAMSCEELKANVIYVSEVRGIDLNLKNKGETDNEL